MSRFSRSFFAVIMCLQALTVAICSGSAEAQAITFSKHFPITSSVSKIVRLSDGSYLLGGAKRLRPFLFKLDDRGKKKWSKKYVLEPGFVGFLDSIVAMPDNTVFVLGERVKSENSDSDPLLLKTDASGNVLWAKVITGKSSDHVYSVVNTSDQGYLLVGDTLSFAAEDYSDGWAIKIDSRGRIEWSKVFGRRGEDTLFSGVETADGGYLLAGSVDILGVPDNQKIVVVKLDANGDLKWKKFYSVDSPAWFEAWNMVASPDGGSLLFGMYSSDLATQPLMGFLLKINRSGAIDWQMTVYAGENSGLVAAFIDSQKNFVVSGNFSSNDTTNGLIINIDLSGNIIWSKKSKLPITELIQEADKGFTLLGGVLGFVSDKNYDSAVARVDTSGNTADCAIVKAVRIKKGESKIAVKQDTLTIVNVDLKTRHTSVNPHNTSLAALSLCDSVE